MKEPQDLPRQKITAQVGLETEPLIRFHGIRALILQLVSAQLVQQPDAPAFLKLVNQNPALLLRDLLDRQLELLPAIATQAMKHVACQTLRVNPYQRRLCATELASRQHGRLFHYISRAPLESINSERPEPRREIGFRHFAQLEFRSGFHGGNSIEDLNLLL